MKILLVDDDQICQMPIKTFSKKLGLDVDVANNGKEGLEKVKNNDYDLILLDIYMPEMDGYQTINAIRNLSKGGEYKIIAMSGGNINFDV
jgi:CheY-like chemotaxis protein